MMPRHFTALVYFSEPAKFFFSPERTAFLYISRLECDAETFQADAPLLVCLDAEPDGANVFWPSA